MNLQSNNERESLELLHLLYNYMLDHKVCTNSYKYDSICEMITSMHLSQKIINSQERIKLHHMVESFYEMAVIEFNASMNITGYWWPIDEAGYDTRLNFIKTIMTECLLPY